MVWVTCSRTTSPQRIAGFFTFGNGGVKVTEEQLKYFDWIWQNDLAFP